MEVGRDKDISIFLVDHHTLVRASLVRLLNDQEGMTVSHQAGTAEQVLETLRSTESTSPDVVILDAHMPGLDCIDFVRAIVEEFPECKLIALSAVANGVVPSQILRAGARGFITKNANIEAMNEAIRAVHYGKRFVTPELAGALSVKPFNRDRGYVFNRLSRREMQICVMLTDGKRVSEIASLLELSPKTVYSYRYRIFDKMCLSSDVELTILAAKHGLTANTKEFDEIPYRGTRRDGNRA